MMQRMFCRIKMIFYIEFKFRKNPRFPCPCTFRQANSDMRFFRLWSETFYESQNSVVCFAPVAIFWTRIAEVFQPLRSQVQKIDI